MKSVTRVMVVLCLAASLPGPAHADTNAVMALGTRFIASNSARIRVDFGSGIPAHHFPAVVHGRGRVYGYMLRKVGAYVEEGRRPFIEDIGISECRQEGCKGPEPIRLSLFYATGDTIAGLWDLYVIADGAPVSVTIGENVQKIVRPAQPVDDQIESLEPRASIEDGDRVMSAGGHTELDEVDFGLLGLWAKGEVGHNTTFGECFYARGTAQVPAEAAFVPGCPMAEGDPWVEEADQRPSGMSYTSAYHGEYTGIGGWYATTAEIRRLGATAYWLDL